jgi:cytochrome c oxidase subunit 1
MRPVDGRWRLVRQWTALCGYGVQRSAVSGTGANVDSILPEVHDGFATFFAGGLMALLMRTELAVPGLQFLSNEQFNQLFTMHGTIMLLLYATPIVFGFANIVLPLQTGALDVAFPRLNALSFWLFVFGAAIVFAGFITPGGAADFGWTAYAPLSNAIHSPGVGGDRPS